MTTRIRDFLRSRRENHQDDGPCLVVDLDVVRENYLAFARVLPDTRVFYAVRPTLRRPSCSCWASSAPRSMSLRWRRPRPCWRPA